MDAVGWSQLGFAEDVGTRSAVVGEGAERVERAVSLLLGELVEGRATGAQLHVRRDREVLVDVGVGERVPGAQMHTGAMFQWFCCVKPMAALVFAALWQSGELAPELRVSQILPEFVSGGKSAVTFAHLLTHTAGWTSDPCYSALWADRPTSWDVILKADLDEDAPPGRIAYYSQFASWFVLAEAIERLCAKPYDEVFADVAANTLDAFDQIRFAIPTDEADTVDERLAPMFDHTRLGDPDVFAPTAEPWQRAVYCPGATGVGSARALASVAEAFLPGSPVLDSTTAAAMRSKHRVGLWDEHWSGFVSWGLGLVADGSYWGNHTSPSTIGHSGLNSCFVAADPDASLTVALTVNTVGRSGQSVRRDRAVCDAVYEELGLASARPAPEVTAVEPSTHSASRATHALEEARFWSGPTSTKSIPSRETRC